MAAAAVAPVLAAAGLARSCCHALMSRAGLLASSSRVPAAMSRSACCFVQMPTLPISPYTCHRPGILPVLRSVPKALVKFTASTALAFLKSAPLATHSLHWLLIRLHSENVVLHGLQPNTADKCSMHTMFQRRNTTNSRHTCHNPASNARHGLAVDLCSSQASWHLVLRRYQLDHCPAHQGPNTCSSGKLLVSVKCMAWVRDCQTQHALVLCACCFD